MFFLAYHLHWAYADVLDMSTDERWHFVRLLSDHVRQEQAELERARARR